MNLLTILIAFAIIIYIIIAFFICYNMKDPDTRAWSIIGFVFLGVLSFTTIAAIFLLYRLIFCGFDLISALFIIVTIIIWLWIFYVIKKY